MDSWRPFGPSSLYSLNSVLETAVKLFGGKQNYLAAIRELETALYSKAA